MPLYLSLLIEDFIRNEIDMHKNILIFLVCLQISAWSFYTSTRPSTWITPANNFDSDLELSDDDDVQDPDFIAEIGEINYEGLLEYENAYSTSS